MCNQRISPQRHKTIKTLYNLLLINFCYLYFTRIHHWYHGIFNQLFIKSVILTSTLRNRSLKKYSVMSQRTPYFFSYKTRPELNKKKKQQHIIRLKRYMFHWCIRPWPSNLNKLSVISLCKPQVLFLWSII